MNSKGASAGCRTAHHHHYYHHHHHHHRVVAAAATAAAATTRAANSSFYDAIGDHAAVSSGAANGVTVTGSGSRVLMNRTMDSLNYWKRAFGNPEQMGGLGERLIRLGPPGARSSSATGAVGNTAGVSAVACQQPNDCYFVATKERKVSMPRSSCKCIRTSASAAKLQLLKTLSPIQNSPQFLESPIAAMARKSSETEHRAGDENFAARPTAASDCYKYGIDDLTDTDDAPSAPLDMSMAAVAVATRHDVDCLDSELETDAPPAAALVAKCADKRQKMSPRRKTISAAVTTAVAPIDSAQRSQLETTVIGGDIRQRQRRNTGNDQRGTVIGIADYYEGADYALPARNVPKFGFIKPSVMMYNNNNNNSNNNHNIVSDRRKTSQNLANNNINYFYGDRSNTDSFNLSQNNNACDNNNVHNKNGPIDENNKMFWSNHVNISQNNNEDRTNLFYANAGHMGSSACALAATRTGASDTGGAATAAAAVGVMPASSRPSTGIYDDEDGTLVFAIEI